MKQDKAFSGLEAAIVLIAFVVVAAVFSYVMLGAGFFATQKSQEVTYSGVKQATSNIVLDGTIVGISSPLKYVEFNIGIPEGGQAQKLGDITFITTVGSSMSQPSPTFKNRYGSSFQNTHVLGAGEKVLVRLEMDPTVSPGGSFTIEMKPKIGASTLISKSIGTGYAEPGGVII